jgi:adenosylhomocysteine nucleosidase
MRTGIIAALPGELQPLVRGWERMPAAKDSGVRLWQTSVGQHEVVASCAGMGAPAARRAFAAAEFLGAMDLVVSVGWAGALREESGPGECFEISEIVDVLTGERFRAEGVGVRLVTTVRVADADEKRRLADSYGAALVDMEAAAVARLAQMRAIPVRCFKAVSDGYQALLPDLNPFINVSGQLEMPRFLAYVALRPAYWGPLAQLGRNSALAANTLASKVKHFLENEA